MCIRDSVYVADMDGDGDMDILSASWIDNTIALYDNNGAANPTWTPVYITTDSTNARDVFAADMDGDGDLDVISASFNDSTTWYENNGCTGSTWTATNVPMTALGASSVFAADMDGDGDNDIVSAYSANNTIAWYETSVGKNTFDRIMLEQDVYPSSTYSITYYLKGGGRGSASFTGTNAQSLLQVQSMQSAYQVSQTIAAPTNWTQQTFSFTTDANTYSVAILFSAMSQTSSVSIQLDNINMSGTVSLVCDIDGDGVPLSLIHI